MMTRTQILLSDVDRRALDAAAQRTGKSIASLVQDAVQLVYGAEQSSEDDLAAMRLSFGAWRDHDLDGEQSVDHLRSAPCIGGPLSRSLTTLPLSEAKARFLEIAEQVATTHERVQVTRDGRDYVVLLASEDLESFEGTLELLSDPESMARMRCSEQDIEHGEFLDEKGIRALPQRPAAD